jgi:hypothetical protein
MVYDDCTTVVEAKECCIRCKIEERACIIWPRGFSRRKKFRESFTELVIALLKVYVIEFGVDTRPMAISNQFELARNCVDDRRVAFKRQCRR